jgi:hypothetical protein
LFPDLAKTAGAVEALSLFTYVYVWILVHPYRGGKTHFMVSKFKVSGVFNGTKIFFDKQLPRKPKVTVTSAR